MPRFEYHSVSTRVSYSSAAARHMLPGVGVKTSLASTCAPRAFCGLGAVRLSSVVSMVPLLRISPPRLALTKSDPWIRSPPPATASLPMASLARPSQVVLAPMWNRLPRSQSTGSLVNSETTPPSASLPYSAELALRTISTDFSASTSIPNWCTLNGPKSNCSDIW